MSSLLCCFKCFQQSALVFTGDDAIKFIVDFLNEIQGQKYLFTKSSNSQLNYPYWIEQVENEFVPNCATGKLIISPGSNENMYITLEAFRNLFIEATEYKAIFKVMDYVSRDCKVTLEDFDSALEALRGIRNKFKELRVLKNISLKYCPNCKYVESYFM